MLGSKVGPYEIIEKLDEGAMGEVYLARDTKLERDVALKVLPKTFAADPDRLERFEREARTLAQLNHPNIAQVYGLERADAPIIVMELVEGEDLATRIAQRPLSLSEALPVARQIAAALEGAHEAGVVHRDLKPANVRMRPDGTVKVLDFGLAKVASEAPSSAESFAESPTMLSPTMTSVGMIVGTAAYMSPEQARGRPVDHRADVWAFGCMLFELLAGQRAFAGEDASMTIASVLKHDIDWSALPDDTPPEVRRLIERCLEPEPRRRYQSIGDVRIDIEEWLSEGFAEPRAGGSQTPVGPHFWRQPAVVAGIALAIVALAFAAGRWSVPVPDPEPVTRLSLERERHAQVALSPTGGELALAGEDGLSLRARNREEPRPLPEAGIDVSGPFFSPDGAWIGYFSANQLRKVPLDGGPSVPINTRAMPFRFCGNADWSVAGQIVFQCADSRGLWIVPAAGGGQRRLTAPPEGERHAFPAFLPGGRSVIFAVGTRPEDGGPTSFELAVVEVDGSGAGSADAGAGAEDADGAGGSDAVQRLGVEGSAPRYLASGHLLFARDDAVWAVAFDPERLAITGEPVPVIEDVTAASPFGFAYYAVSSDGAMAYWSGPARRATPAYPVVFDRSGATVSEFPDLVGAQRPRLSPDARRMVFDFRSDEGIEFDVRIVELARGASSRVDTGYALGWSPDGAAVIYGLAGDDGFDIYRRPWDLSADAELVATLPAPTGSLSWTPEGDAFVFANTRGDRDTGISNDIGSWSRDDGIDWLLETGAQEANPELSPDGRWLAYQYAESQREPAQVFIRPFPEPGGRTQVSVDGGRTPRWAGDGNSIFFWHDDAVWEAPLNLSADEPVGQPVLLFPVDVDGPSAGQFDVSRDGTRFVVYAEQEVEQEPPTLHVVYNWSAELQGLLGGER